MQRRSMITPAIEAWLTPANKIKRFHDPWTRLEAWRYLPEHSMKAKIPHLLPGFFWGIGLFVVLATTEEAYYYWKNDVKNSTVLWYKNKDANSDYH